MSKIPGSIDLTLGEPDFATPEHICRAAKEAMDEGFTHYTPTAGILELRQAISEKLRRQNRIVADPNGEVLVTVGAMEAVMLTMQTMINEGDEVLVPDPAFDSYVPNVLLAGAKPVLLPLADPDFRVDPSKVAKLVTEKTKMIVLNSPSNPMGSIIDADDQKSILDIAIKNNLIIMSDEVYEDMTYDGYHHHSIASLPEGLSRCVTIFSFSKVYAMTGWRVGYMVSPSEIISKMTKLHRNTVAHPTSIAQKAALAALTGPQDSVTEMVREFDRRRIFLLQALQGLNISCSRPKGAFYLFPSMCEFGDNSGAIAESLAKEGAVTVPGSAFGACGEGHLRISYATSMEKLDKAVKAMERWVKSHRKQDCHMKT